MLTQQTGEKLIVIGASAGGIEALMRLVPGLPSDLRAPVLIVVHTSPRAKSLLPRLLSRAGKLPAKYAEDGEEMLPANIYVAPPDMHLTVEHQHMRLDHGPRENLTRPAIDPLFRTAAATFDGDVIGVILSGTLDDGTAGLAAIKKAGGMAIVQDPEETVFKGMPFHAIENVSVDYISSAAHIADLLVELCENGERIRAPMTPSHEEQKLSSYLCPECGGPLWESECENVLRFRCRVGHIVSVQSLMSGQSENIEKVLWSAVRALEERSELLHRLAARLRKRDANSTNAVRFETQSTKSAADAKALQKLLAKRDDIDDIGSIAPSTKARAQISDEV